IYIVWIFFLCYLNISVVNLFSLLIGICGLEFQDTRFAIPFIVLTMRSPCGHKSNRKVTAS
ncbi:MAG: hypothetical protein PHS23_01700, partial [Candidatus Cloacimonetes bacterium]|nr:hypothetical protein [Candidatus Cloacimonadota bacterium]